MRRAEIFVQKKRAGILEEIEIGREYRFCYDNDYNGPPVSLTMPVENRIYEFNKFPPFFDGLLQEGVQLESLLRLCKIDRDDHFSQLIIVGNDMVGSVTAKELK